MSRSAVLVTGVRRVAEVAAALEEAGGTHRKKVRGFWSRLRDWRSLRGSSPCHGSPFRLLMIWLCKSLRARRGPGDRKKNS